MWKSIILIDGFWIKNSINLYQIELKLFEEFFVFAFKAFNIFCKNVILLIVLIVINYFNCFFFSLNRNLDFFLNLFFSFYHYVSLVFFLQIKVINTLIHWYLLGKKSNSFLRIVKIQWPGDQSRPWLYYIFLLKLPVASKWYFEDVFDCISANNLNRIFI